jgi:hypothetical protein
MIRIAVLLIRNNAEAKLSHFSGRNAHQAKTIVPNHRSPDLGFIDHHIDAALAIFVI